MTNFIVKNLSAFNGGHTTILLGDSIFAQQTIETPVPLSTTNYGFIPWAIALSNSQWDIIRNAGIPSQTSAQILARVGTDVIAYSPTACEVMAGTNDSPAFTNTISNLRQIYQQLQNASIYVRAYTILPRPDLSTAGQGALLTVNNWIREYWRAQPSGAGECVDAFAFAVNPLSTGMAWPVNWSADNVHPTSLGGFNIGQGCSYAFSKWNTPLQLPSSAADDVNVLSAASNLSANPLFQGTAGTLGGFTGSVATNWGLTGNVSAITASLAARADGFGNDQVLAITSAGAQFARLTSAFQSFGAGLLAIGSKYFVTAEINIAGSPSNLGSVLVQATSNGQVAGTLQVYSTQYALNIGSGGIKLKVRSPIVTIISGSTYLLQISTNFVGAGSATVNIGRAALYSYPTI